MSMSARTAGVWKAVSALHARAGGVWKTVSAGYVRIGGVWKQFYSSSSPPAVHFTVSVSGPTSLGPISVGGSVITTYQASLNVTSGTPNNPIYYNWTVGNLGGGQVGESFSGQGSSEITVTYTGQSAGSATAVVSVTAVDAVGNASAGSGQINTSITVS